MPARDCLKYRDALKGRREHFGFVIDCWGHSTILVRNGPYHWPSEAHLERVVQELLQVPEEERETTGKRRGNGERTGGVQLRLLTAPEDGMEPTYRSGVC